MDAVQAANSGHPGMPMGMADVATVLWSQFLTFDPAAPKWPDRDRFVLSAGHGSMLIYAALHLSGYAAPTMDDIRNFRQMGSPCAGHPENDMLEGVECTTGPLGQGVAMAVGMAMAERHLNAAFGDDLVDHKTWVIAGDGCLMEGVNHEAVGLAGTLKLGRLNVLWDDNKITIDGDTSLSTSEDILARYDASGWHTTSCDGHDFADIARALAEAAADPRPSLVACRTVIGKGAPNKQGGHNVHGAPLGADEIAAARAYLGWTSAPFEVPAETLTNWRSTGETGKAAHAAWAARFAASPARADFESRLAGVADLASPALESYIRGLVAAPQKVASRKASEMALGPLTEQLPQLVGGSADLTGSVFTRTKFTPQFSADAYDGRHVAYGIREFGMAAAMNGMALHGGVVPYGGTFLVFSDYCRNAIRMSALQHAQVVYVMTHDSIGLGEDGPTHQPVETLASLRCIPNLTVYRPADAIETGECWELAIKRNDGPSVLALSRQNLTPFRTDHGENRCARGGYVVLEAEGPRRVTLIASGSEVQLALVAHAALAAEGIAAAVVSLPSFELFAAQDPSYHAEVLGSALRVGIEAAIGFGWDRWLGPEGIFIGMSGFGASAPAEDLFRHFGITPEAVVAAVRKRLG